MKPLYLIVGPSGSGKNFFCSKMHFTTIPSYTTRPRRANEVDGVEHIFVDKEKFLQDYKNGNMILVAFTIYCDNLYWTTKDMLLDMKYDSYIIDPNGLAYLLTHNAHILTRPYSIIYIKCNICKRIWRMYKRGDTITQIIKRIITDYKEFKLMKPLIAQYKNNIISISL